MNNRAIMIGDYADITFDKVNNSKISKTFRYYIVKIEAEGITIAQYDDPNQKFLLVNLENVWGIGISGYLNNIWRISGYDEPHTVKFSKNATDTQYFERELGHNPEKIIFISEYNNPETINNFDKDFTELSNGVIFYKMHASFNSPNNPFKFSDPSNDKKNFLGTIEGSNLEQSRNFLNYTITTRFNETYFDVINFDKENSREIFIYLDNQKTILKFDLNTSTATIVERNYRYKTLFPLKDRKILCLFTDLSIYILDLTNNTHIPINATALGANYTATDIHQLSSGDILLKFKDFTNPNGAFYRINLKERGLVKLSTPTLSFKIISILQDDKLLIRTPEMADDSIGDLDEIKIWNPITGEFTSVSTIIQANYANAVGPPLIIPNRPLSNIPLPNIPLPNIPLPNIPLSIPNARMQRIPVIPKAEGILLRNGDVLFTTGRNFYLFNHTDQTITELTSFKYFKSAQYFQELKNGNILIRSRDYLAILEFPKHQHALDLKSYDAISSSVKNLPQDIVKLIKEYL